MKFSLRRLIFIVSEAKAERFDEGDFERSEKSTEACGGGLLDSPSPPSPNAKSRLTARRFSNEVRKSRAGQSERNEETSSEGASF